MSKVSVGDRVYVIDSGLSMLREVMRRSTGKQPRPNHHGTVHDIWDDGSVEIWFDNEDGEGQGQSAPYPPEQVRSLITDHNFEPGKRGDSCDFTYWQAVGPWVVCDHPESAHATHL